MQVTKLKGAYLIKVAIPRSRRKIETLVGTDHWEEVIGSRSNSGSFGDLKGPSEPLNYRKPFKRDFLPARYAMARVRLCVCQSVVSGCSVETLTDRAGFWHGVFPQLVRHSFVTKFRYL